MTKPKMTGARAVIECLYRENVEVIFGYPGGVVLPLYDELYDANITGITLPITKHNYLVQETKDLPRIFKEAFYIARTGRPGPVLIDIPKDVQTEIIEFEYPEEVKLRSYKPTYIGNEQQIKKAASLILKAEKPIFYVGGGIIISNACEELKDLAQTIMAPVTTTLMGMGAFPSAHPLSLGMLGMHGTRYANYAIQDSDLIIAIGVRFDDRVTGKISAFAPNAKIIHIDIDPAEIGKNVRVDIPIVGDAKNILKSLARFVKIEQPKTDAWVKKIHAWKKELSLIHISEPTRLGMI